MEDHDSYIKALIELHAGLERQGPGDAEFSRYIIGQLPALPANPRIADLGCGAGAGSLILAEHFRSRVKAVDFSRVFLDQLAARARQAGLEEYIEIIECDFAKLGWDKACLDLIWSEGAAYNLTFAGALEAWRPLLAGHGIAVISEMNYFTDSVPPALGQYMQNVYPAINAEAENIDLIGASGFEVLGVHRLPTRAWWENYYDPLSKKIKQLKDLADPTMQLVISETEQEMRYFAEFHEEYGYTCFIMQADERSGN